MRNLLLSRYHVSLLLIVTGAVIFSTQAEQPRVALDGNPGRPEIAPIPVSVIPGEKLLVAVTAGNIAYMHSYSVKCTFNPEVVAFEGAAAKLSPRTPAFLESKGGKIAAFFAVPGNGTVDIAATQTGRTPATCVGGTGILGYLSFTAISKGNPGLSIVETRIVDPDGTSTFAVIVH